METTLAHLEKLEDGIIVVRIKRGATLSAAGYAELLVARKALAQGKPAGVVNVMPGDADFDMSIMNVDHHEGADVTSFTKAMAIVTDGALHERLSEIYFKYHPPDFDLELFRDEPSALAWVRERMARS